MVIEQLVTSICPCTGAVTKIPFDDEVTVQFLNEPTPAVGNKIVPL